MLGPTVSITHRVLIHSEYRIREIFEGHNFEEFIILSPSKYIAMNKKYGVKWRIIVF